MIDRILSAPLWLLVPIVFAVGATAMLAVTSRGREALRAIGRAVRRPVAALLLGTIGAGLSSLMTTIAVTCVFLGPPYVNFKGAASVLLFGALLGLPAWLPVILVRSLPVFVLVWLPLWAARGRFAAFWRWSVAPLTGGVLTYFSWVIIEAIHPLFPDEYQYREFITAARVGALADGVCMFAVGCRWPSRKRRAPHSTAPVLPGVEIKSDETRAA